MKWVRYFVIYPLLSLLPPALAYRLAELAYRYDPELRRPTRIAVANGMRRGLPEAKQQDILQQWLNQYQAMMGRELLDVYYLPRLSARTIDRWASIIGLQYLQAPRPDQRGRILIMAHYSRPSLLFAALGLKGIKLHILTQAIGSKNLELKSADRLFLRFKVWANQRHMLGKWITTNDSPRFMYERLKAGETVVVLFDVRCKPGEPQSAASFLQHRLIVPQGIQRLACKTNAALYYGRIRDQGRRVQINIEPFADQSGAAAIQMAASMLEKEVLSDPAQWWQWNIFDYLIQQPEQDIHERNHPAT